ncbi:hypothetical protein [Myxococcus sp. CA040A]|uniref:hypothetical protein n=1 Tax=Myxococcus sp. CA040A TaxID=2741738 RepID=UPI00157A24D1|nr:hypothetical protein [Myxococcus sp. CA040A]NTX08965.1 hypothetical protein [Myxococcus sp. CA040A]
MSAKPMQVTVLLPDGTPTGTVDVYPTNTLWRAQRRAPHVHVHGIARDLEPRGDGWALRLLKGELAPRNAKRRAA